MLSSQISVPIRGNQGLLQCLCLCLLEGLKCSDSSLLLDFFFFVCTHWGVSDQCFCVCVCLLIHTNLNLHIYVCVIREQLCLICFSALFQSSRPVLHQGRQEAFVKEALGLFLILASLFLRYTTRLPNLLMNNTNSAEQVCSFYRRESVKALDVFLSWHFEFFSTSLTVCV